MLAMVSAFGAESAVAGGASMPRLISKFVLPLRSSETTPSAPFWCTALCFSPLLLWPQSYHKSKRMQAAYASRMNSFKYASTPARMHSYIQGYLVMNDGWLAERMKERMNA